MISFLKSLFQKKYFTGVLPDNRSLAEKQKDWLHEEVASSPVINYVTKEEADKQKLYVVYNQKSTSSCVAHATATEITILKKKIGKVFKGMALFIYRLRSNYPGEGMIGNNSNEIAIDKGIPNATVATEPSTESVANSFVITEDMYQDALNNKPVGYFKFQNLTWENIASVVSNGKAVKIFIDATYREWAKEYVSVMDKPVHGYAPISHAITCLPNTVFKEGNEEYVLIQDSAWFGGFLYRYVPKSFFDAGRCYYASYFTELEFKSQNTKPVFKFTIPLRYGNRGIDVKALQDRLIYEGLLPADCNTGWFGGLTLKAVKLFQLKYTDQILKPVRLTEPTGYVGEMTLKVLNS